MSGEFLPLAVAFVCLPVLLVPAYIRLLYIFHIKFSHNLSYRLMFHQGVGDILLLVAQFAAGISAITDVPMPYWLNKVFGAIFNGGYQCSIPFVLLLSINRLLVICNFVWLHPLLESRLAPLWIGIPYLWGLCLGISYLTPKIDVLFELNSFSWTFCGDYGEPARLVDLYAGEAILIASTVIYICLLGYIFLKRLANRAVHAAVSRTYDYGLLMNVFLTYMTLTILLLAFHIQPRISDTKMASGIVNLLITLVYYAARLFTEPVAKAVLDYGRRHPWFKNRVLIPFGNSIYRLNVRVSIARGRRRRTDKVVVNEVNALQQASDFVNQVVMFSYSLAVVWLYYTYVEYKSRNFATMEDLNETKKSSQKKFESLKIDVENCGVDLERIQRVLEEAVVVKPQKSGK